MPKYIKTSQQAQNIQTITNQEGNNIDIGNMKKRVETIKEEIVNSTPYFCKCIRPKLAGLTLNHQDLSLLKAYALGSYLIHAPAIQGYTVISYYHLTGEGDIYAIAEEGNSLYGFFIDYNGFASFKIYDKEKLKGYMFKASTFVGKTLAEIAHEFNIPYVEQIPLIYEPVVPHKMIEEILNASKNYLENYIFPKFTGIPEDSEEWVMLTASCQGSILAHHPLIDFPILEHYRRGNYLDFLVVERKDADTVYCFVLDSSNKVPLLRYGMYGSDSFKGQKAKKFVGKSLKAVLKKRSIPLVSELPDLFN